MKTVVTHRYGPPDGPALEKIDTPDIGERDVRGKILITPQARPPTNDQKEQR